MSAPKENIQTDFRFDTSFSSPHPKKNICSRISRIFWSTRKTLSIAICLDYSVRMYFKVHPHIFREFLSFSYTSTHRHTYTTMCSKAASRRFSPETPQHVRSVVDREHSNATDLIRSCRRPPPSSATTETEFRLRGFFCSLSAANTPQSRKTNVAVAVVFVVIDTRT